MSLTPLALNYPFRTTKTVKVANQVTKAANFPAPRLPKTILEEPMVNNFLSKLIKITTLIEKLLFISKPTLEHYVLAEGPGA